MIFKIRTSGSFSAVSRNFKSSCNFWTVFFRISARYDIPEIANRSLPERNIDIPTRFDISMIFHIRIRTGFLIFDPGRAAGGNSGKGRVLRRRPDHARPGQPEAQAPGRRPHAGDAAARFHERLPHAVREAQQGEHLCLF